MFVCCNDNSALKRQHCLITLCLASQIHGSCFHFYSPLSLSSPQAKLVDVVESISDKLSYFTELERIGSRVYSLSLTSGNAQTSLMTTLARLDQCILFIEKNVGFYVVYMYVGQQMRCGGAGVSVWYVVCMYVLRVLC